MVYKLCAVCQKYFAGELNGSYICPDCRARQQPATPAARSTPAAAGAGAAGRPISAPHSPRAA